MNYGDWMLTELAQQAGATYGDDLVRVSIEYHEANTLDAWGMELWTKFEVLTLDGDTEVHYTPGSPSQLTERLLKESTTIPVEW